jgi:hypothetical protein
MNRCHRLVCLFTAIALCAARSDLASAQTQIVFAPFEGANDQPEMQIANSDGTNVHSVLPPAHEDHVLSLTVDPRNQMIYYGGWAADYEIGRVHSDGTGKTTLYSLHALDPLVFNRSNATPSPYGISIDTVHNKLYWVGGQNNTNGFGSDIPTFIQRANLDGSNVETVQQTLWSVSSPYGLAVDGLSGKMYWTDESNFSIRRANLDGSGMQTILNRGTGASTFPWLLGGLAIDFQHQQMFWSELTPDHQNSNIMSAGLDGTGVHSLLTVSGAEHNWFDMPVVIGMAVDPAASVLYFADSTGSIKRTNYDGSGIQTLIAPTSRPFSIGVLPVPEPGSIFLGLSAIPGFWLIRKAYRRLPAASLDPRRLEV